MNTKFKELSFLIKTKDSQLQTQVDQSRFGIILQGKKLIKCIIGDIPLQI